MLSVGGLKAAAKRTAFGDVSNTAKTISSSHDDSALSGKAIDIVKPLALQDKSAGFLRPAQRPLNTTSAKVHLNSAVGLEATSISTNKVPLGDSQPSHQQSLAITAKKPTLTKRNTAIYKDNAEVEQSIQTATRPESAPTAPVHQNLAPRHQQSQLQINLDQPPLRRSLSKFTGVERSETIDPNDSIHQQIAGKFWGCNGRGRCSLSKLSADDGPEQGGRGRGFQGNPSRCRETSTSVACHTFGI